MHCLVERISQLPVANEEVVAPSMNTTAVGPEPFAATPLPLPTAPYCSEALLMTSQERQQQQQQQQQSSVSVWTGKKESCSRESNDALLLTASEMYNTVYRTIGPPNYPQEDGGNNSTSAAVSASSGTPSVRTPPDDDTELISSLKDTIPYVPPQSDYTVARETYEKTYLNIPFKKQNVRKHTSPKKKTKKKKKSPDASSAKGPRAASRAAKRAPGRPGSNVLGVAEWSFPEHQEASRWATIDSAIRKNQEPGYVSTHNDSGINSSNPASSNTPRPSRKRRVTKPPASDSNGDTIWNSLVQDVWFDTRYWQYDVSPYGSLDQLVARAPDSHPEQCMAPSERYLQAIPDPPISLVKASRIGPMFQARVCSRKEDYHDKRNGSYLPEYEAIWDPVLADEAERNGQDIEGFLGKNMMLAEREIRMKILHSSGYDVAAANQFYERIRRFGWEEDASWSPEETMKLETILKQMGGYAKNQFTRIAKRMNRSRGDCLVHYYRWKSTSASYPDMKKAWRYNNREFCKVCNDGGALILCDRCDDAYHTGCLDPPLSAVPRGEWFCPTCVGKKRAMGAGLLSRAVRPSPSKALWAVPARNATPVRKAKLQNYPEESNGTPRQLFTAPSPRVPEMSVPSPVVPPSSAEKGSLFSSDCFSPESEFVFSDESSAFSEPPDV